MDLAGGLNSQPTFTGALRPYQSEALDGIDTQLALHRSTICVLPTGTGKTVVFAAAAARYRPRGRVLVIAHREELIEQACEKIQAFTSLSTAVEMAERRAELDSLMPPDVVVASVQSLSKKRLARFRRDAFDFIVIDEGHHATSKSYRDILDYFSAAKVLGVTATPDRLDGRAMREVFESKAFVFEIRQAIEQGYLVPIRQRSVIVDALDLSAVKRKKSGDFDDGALEEAMLDEAVLHQICRPTLELAGARPTILFAAGVKQARALASVLNAMRPGCATSVDGSIKRELRAERLAAFQAGRVQFLTNCAVLTEGFDAPPTSCVAVARPTASRALYTQMVGRGTRLHPGKSDLLVLDYVGNSGRHSLVSVVDVLDGLKNPKVRERAMQLIERHPSKTVLDAIDEADAAIAAEVRAAMLSTRAVYRIEDVDPFIVLGASARDGRFGGMPPTDRQLDALVRAGINVDGLDKGQCSALLDKIVERGKAGMCTFKMARQLARFGLNPDVSFDVAREAIDAIAKAKWRAPEWLYQDPRFAKPTVSEAA